MALSVDDVIQVSIRGTLFDQRIITVLHYIVNVAHTGSTEQQLLDLATDLKNGTGSVPGWESHMLDAQGIEYTLTAIRCQRVYPARTIYREVSVGDVGQHADSCTTANIAASILKQTATPGRKGIGRVQLAGIPQTQYAAGILDPTYLATKITPICVDWTSSYTTSVGPVTYVPGLFNPTGTGNHFSPMIAMIPEDTVRTMHRRTLRVGE